MRAGRLRHRIGIQVVTYGISATGQRVEDRGTLYSMFANVKFLGGGESEKSESRHFQRKAVFTIRERSGLFGPDNYIVYDGQRWEIDAIETVDDMRRYMKIHAHLRGLQDG